MMVFSGTSSCPECSHVGHVATAGEIRTPFPAPSGHSADFSDNASGSVSCLICGDAREVFSTFKG